MNRINELIENKRMPKKQRDSLLKATASEAWTILFPENADPRSTRLSAGVVMHRWDEVSDQLSSNPNADKIIRVLESPANGECFHWLD